MLAAYTMHREWIGVGSDRSVDGDEELLHIDCHRPHQAEVGQEASFVFIVTQPLKRRFRAGTGHSMRYAGPSFVGFCECARSNSVGRLRARATPSCCAQALHRPSLEWHDDAQKTTKSCKESSTLLQLFTDRCGVCPVAFRNMAMNALEFP